MLIIPWTPESCPQCLKRSFNQAKLFFLSHIGQQFANLFWFIHFLLSPQELGVRHAILTTNHKTTNRFRIGGKGRCINQKNSTGYDRLRTGTKDMSLLSTIVAIHSQLVLECLECEKGFVRFHKWEVANRSLPCLRHRRSILPALQPSPLTKPKS